MLSFFNKRKSVSDIVQYLPIKTDIHSHVLFGIDDGAPDIETSIRLIKGVHDIGITKIVATPHIIGDTYRNTPAIITAALEKVKSACVEANLDIELSAAAEYMLDDHFMMLLKSEPSLLTIHKNIILTEQSYAVANHNINEIAFEITTDGYRPIMAHPERYYYYHRNYDEYYRLKEIGFLLQVNLLSLTGFYGRPVAKAARFILEKGLADFVATDIHHVGHLALLKDKKNLALIHKYIDKRIYNDLTDW